MVQYGDPYVIFTLCFFQRLQSKVLKLVDVSYGGENGFNQVSLFCSNVYSVITLLLTFLVCTVSLRPLWLILGPIFAKCISHKATGEK